MSGLGPFAAIWTFSSPRLLDCDAQDSLLSVMHRMDASVAVTQAQAMAELLQSRVRCQATYAVFLAQTPPWLEN